MLGPLHVAHAAVLIRHLQLSSHPSSPATHRLSCPSSLLLQPHWASRLLHAVSGGGRLRRSAAEMPQSCVVAHISFTISAAVAASAAAATEARDSSTWQSVRDDGVRLLSVVTMSSVTMTRRTSMYSCRMSSLVLTITTFMISSGHSLKLGKTTLIDHLTTCIVFVMSALRIAFHTMQQPVAPFAVSREHVHRYSVLPNAFAISLYSKFHLNSACKD